MSRRSILVWMLAGVAAGGACGAPPDPAADPGAAASPTDSGRTAVLYHRHCALCHGANGQADGPASELLFPRPRDFSHGLFDLVSTRNGVPTDDDLVRVLERGMPGSAMPAWSWLPPEDLRALAGHVRELVEDRLLARAKDQAELRGRAFDEAQARDHLAAYLTPGPVLTPPEIEITPELRARGAELYRTDCAACHGVDGRGRKPTPDWAGAGEGQFARDFTAGVLKGGRSRTDLFRRIRAGMPASGMPPSGHSDRDVAALVSHVQGLLGDVAEPVVQRRQQLVANRVEDVPVEPGDARWSEAALAQFVLSPLVWREAAIRHLEVAAVHDGEWVAVRLSWVDPTDDTGVLTSLPSADAAAIQFSSAPEPPLFGMGSRRHPVEIWHWRGRSRRTLALPDDLALGDAKADTVHRAATVEATRTILAEGLGSEPGVLRKGFDVRSRVERTVAGWAIVFVRELSGRSGDSVELSPGRAVQFSCAVWNGAAGDATAEKSISIWHELTLAK